MRDSGQRGVDELAVGVGSERIAFDTGEPWAMLRRDDEFAWLDVYGAFLGNSGEYQVKDPFVRAATLRRTGGA